jgi:hypothetical protein
MRRDRGIDRGREGGTARGACDRIGGNGGASKGDGNGQ